MSNPKTPSAEKWQCPNCNKWFDGDHASNECSDNHSTPQANQVEEVPTGQELQNILEDALKKLDVMRAQMMALEIENEKMYSDCQKIRGALKTASYYIPQTKLRMELKSGKTLVEVIHHALSSTSNYGS